MYILILIEFYLSISASKSFLQSLADEPIKFLFILSMPIATAYVFLKLLHK